MFKTMSRHQPHVSLLNLSGLWRLMRLVYCVGGLLLLCLLEEVKKVLICTREARYFIV